MWPRIMSLVIITLILLAQPTLAGYTPSAQAPQSIIVVCDDNYPPYIFRGAEGNIQGILVDEWHAWEQRTGITVSLKAMDWEKAQETMLRGEADVIDTLFFNEERAKVYDFSKPYARLDVPVFLHKDLGGLSDPQSLRGFTIGVKKGDACIDVLKSYGIDTLKEYNSYHEVILAAKNHDIRLFSIDKPPALYYLYKYGMEDEYRSTFVLYTGEFHRAVKKGRADLLRTVEDGFAAIPSQERKTIEEKWLGAPLASREYVRVLFIAGLSVAGLVLALLVFTYILRRQVRTRTAELDSSLRQLGESEERMRLFFERQIVGAAITTPEKGWENVNERLCSMLGYTFEELQKTTWTELTHPDDLPADAAQFSRLLAGEIDEYAIEKRFLRKDGSVIKTNLSVACVRKADRKVAYVLALVEDITDRKRAEEALCESESKYRSVVEHITDVFYRTNADGLLDMVSPSGVALLGYESMEDMLGKPNESFWMHPEQRGDLLTRLNEQGEVRDYEVVLKRRDGSPVQVSTSSRLIIDESGNPLGVEGTFRDITERKQSDMSLRESREKFRIMFENLPIGLAVTDTTGRYMELNHAFEVIFGSPREQLLGVPPEERDFTVHHSDGTPFQRNELITLRAIAEQRLIQGDHLIRRADGTNRYFSSMAVPMPMPGYGAMLAVLDVTERKRAEMALENSVRQFHSLYDNMAEGVALHSLVHDDSGKLVNYSIETVNKSYESILGFSAQNVQGRLATEVYGTETPPFLDEFSAVAITGVPSHVELYFPPMGRHFAISIAPWGDGGFSTIFSDITAHKQMEEQLLFRALHDPLTGLANRTLCLDRIAQVNERAARDKTKTFAVVFIDLDRFKVINDSLGHEAGDTLLRWVAKRLLDCARKVDTVSRYGGDEFALVLEDVSERETVHTIKRIRESLKAPMLIGVHEVQVEASYGIAYGPRKDCRAEELLRNANIALHLAKHSGRNKIIAYRRGMHEAATHAMQLQSDMRRGLDSSEFFMMYQPIFDLNTNKLSGFESLIRWRHPERGLVNPGEFIPLAEETGFIIELGAFALAQSCSDMVELLLGLPSEDQLTISVNLSPKQFARQGLVDQIEQVIISSGIQPSCLVLEITESSIMNYPEASVHTMARLKQKGVALAIDDFGTGYSSMSALQTMPLDRLKVDMSFVKRMTTSREDREIVRAIITLSHSLGLKTVAEGIETEEQRLALRHMGCDLGQGYLCSRPILLADVPEAIRLKVCMSAV
jgi:diguanylate cyclase (GGDEF)-like protein/PAS domain S-box-containing protein